MTGSYIIMPGDTLSGIAQRNGTSVPALLQQNPQIANPDLIYAGSSLTVPQTPPAPPPPSVQAAVAAGQAADTPVDRAVPADAGGIKQCPLSAAEKNPALKDLAPQTDEETLACDATSTIGDKLDQKVRQATGGMTVEQVQELYKASTEGKEVSRETLETLFFDPQGAKEILMNDTYLNNSLRDVLNTHHPKNLAELENENPPWVKASILENAFHDPLNNTKYVSPDGHRELILNKDGEVVTDPAFKQTFNFFSKDDAWAHKLADVDPWDAEHGEAFAEASPVIAMGWSATKGALNVAENVSDVAGATKDGVSTFFAPTAEDVSQAADFVMGLWP